MAKILLIEPDRILADTYCQALESAGHSTAVCSGAQAGVLTADQFKPDLIIVELQLVEHSGIEFLYEFRSYSDWLHIPVLIQSQVPSSEFQENYQMLVHELGVVGYLYKSLTSLKQLLSAVEAQLESIPA